VDIRNNLKAAKVLLLGEQCTDKYSYGINERINPESPAPLIKILHEEQRLGMAGGIKENLENLGINVVAQLSENLIIKHRFIDLKSNHQVLRVDYDTQLQELKIDELKIDDYELIIVSDYNKGFISSQVIEKLVQIYPGKILVDTKRKDVSIYKETIVKMNKPDFLNAENKDLMDIVVTDGRNGAFYQDKEYLVEATQVVDVTGAGDSFMIGMAIGFLISNKVEESIKLANLFGATAVKHFGVLRINSIMAKEMWNLIEKTFND
jgi:D-beta-D-heptose 7-phosphate kinase/D-beta-D-heptose 1-phosphate adenosyltransferase